MKLFEHLRKELKTNDGDYIPYYFRCLGYRDDMAADVTTMRANGIRSLLERPTPVILPSEWIAGNQRSLFCHENKIVLTYTGFLASRLPSRGFLTNSDHFAPDYDHILGVGLPGLMEEIDASLQVHARDPERVVTLRAMRTCLSGFAKMIDKYRAQAEAMAGTPGYEPQRLRSIADNCRAILNGPPQSFAQALQLVWFCHTAFLMEGRSAMALGRMDQYLYPFYRADVDRGIIQDETVIELLENVFIKLQGDTVNICIGGGNALGECEVNPLSRCILRAVRNCHVPGPNLSLRYTSNTPDDFLDECLETIGTGLGYPAIMNDDVNIAALKKYGYAEEDVYRYCMVGCIENFIPGMQPPWTDGRFDTPRYFDYIFNEGISAISQSIGLNTGRPEDIASMADFMAVFERQLAYAVDEYVFKFRFDNDAINQKFYAEPFLSCFCRDCIERGLDINDGGSRYPSAHGAALMGIGTVSDSLAAIEKVVFIDHEATLGELRDAMNANFVGYGSLRQKLLAAPKYGNNDDFVDKYAVWFMDYLSARFAEKRTRDGGPIYIAAAANTSNISAGKVINATPDGRLAGEPLSDAASPTYGRDTRGATSTINSLTKPDYTKVACGSVVNQKFSPATFTPEKRKKLASLIKTYFKKGGQEIQINATSRETLLDAMDHPENYADLVVRVSGFSAFYVTLDRDIQLDILHRTQQE